MPIIIYHFNTIQIYGFIGNLLIVPIFTFFIMPTVLLTFIFMPFSFYKFFLYILDFEINIINYLTSIIAKFPFNNITYYTISDISFVLIYLGISIRLIFKTNLKNIGYIIILIGFISNFFYKTPDVIVNKFGNIFAIKDDNKINILNLSDYKIKNYEIDEYKKIFKTNNVINTNRKNWLINNTKVAFIDNEKDYINLCKESALIFVTKPRYKMNFLCDQIVFYNIFFLTNKGAEFYINNNEYKIKPIIGINNKRIWE